MTSDGEDHLELATPEAQQPPEGLATKTKPPSPYWWLLLLVIGGAAGKLTAATNSSWWMLVGGIGMLAVFRKMTAHNIQPKKLNRVKPKTLSRK